MFGLLVTFAVGVLIGSIPSYVNKRIVRKANISGTIFVDLNASYNNGSELYLSLDTGIFEVSNMKEITCNIKNVTTRR